MASKSVEIRHTFKKKAISFITKNVTKLRLISANLLASLQHVVHQAEINFTEMHHISNYPHFELESLYYGRFQLV